MADFTQRGTGQFENKVVRDLAWSIGLLSPPLIEKASNDGDACALWKALLAATPPWLVALDKSPQPLEDFLGTLSGLGRVQNYHAGLVQFWLAHAELGEQQQAKEGAPAREPQRRTLWGVQVGGRRLTSDLKLLTALHAEELDGLGDSTVLHVEPGLVFAIDNSSALTQDHCDATHTTGTQACARDDNEAFGVPLGALVSFDLDANLQYRLEVSVHKMQIAGYSQIKDWITKHFQRTKVASISRISGGIFLPLSDEMNSTDNGAHDEAAGFWTEDVEDLVASRPNSRWAIVDWRHFLAPANIVTVPRGELHFSRDITGKPVIVPTAGSPFEMIDDSMGELHSDSDAANGTDQSSNRGREGYSLNDTSDDSDSCIVPPPPLNKADRSFLVQKLQFLLIRIGFLRPSAIRFHTGIYGRHTMAAVGALQAVCGLNPTGQYDSGTAVALKHMVCERTDPPSLNDHGALFGDVVGTAIYPSDLYQRMSDAAKSPEEVQQTNGSVLEIQGTDIDGAGGEQRYRIWKEEKHSHLSSGSSDTIQDELKRKASGAQIFNVAQNEYARQSKQLDETVGAQTIQQPLNNPSGPARARTDHERGMSVPATKAAEAARELRAHRISASRTRRMVRDSEGLWDGSENASRNNRDRISSASPPLRSRSADDCDYRPTSPRLGGGWREQVGTPSVGNDKLTVVQGSLPLLIPHEPVISGAELVARVNAMAGIVVARDTRQLKAAREQMQRFASTPHPSSCTSMPRDEEATQVEPEPHQEQEWQHTDTSAGSAAVSRRHDTNHEAVLWLPAELTELERSVLHGEAEQLGLGHVSIGEAAGRRLLLWKNYQFIPTTADGADGRRTDAFAEPLRRFDALSSAEEQHIKETQQTKTPKVGENQVGPDHEALRVPVTNRRGREIVGNPAALIEIVEDANGELVEGNRGFVLPKAWRRAAMPLTSSAEPLVNQHRSRAHKSTGILASFQSVGCDYWSVCHNSNDPNLHKDKCKKRVWKSIELPAECSGERLLTSLGLWMTACGIKDHTDSALYGPMARRLICQAFDRIDDAKRLLVDMLAWIQAAERDGLETVDRYVAMGHFVLGALTGKKTLSKRAEADLRRQQAAETPPTPVKYVSTASADYTHTSIHSDTVDSARSKLLLLVCEALKRSLDSADHAPAGGMLRLQLKGLLGLRALGPTSNLADTNIAMDRHATQAATVAALSCVDVLMKGFQKDEEDLKLGQSNSQGSSRVLQSVFAMAVELLVELDHRWNDADSLELLHWLVAAGEFTAAARLVENNVKSLAVPMIEEILATGAGAAKKASKYVQQFGLSERFAGIQAKQRKGKKHQNTDGNGAGQPAQMARPEMPTFRLPASVAIHDVATPEQLHACTEILQNSSGISVGDSERHATICAIDAEWEPFGSAESPTKVSLLQLATAEHGVFLIDMLALAVHDSAELQTFWHVLSNEVIVVGFGLSGDLTRICQSYPHLSRCLYQAVELQKLVNALIASSVLHETVGRGLGAICKILLGVDVSKAEQTSHWGSRPISAAQRHYAATDAHVLLPLLVAALRAFAGGGILTTDDSLVSGSTLLTESLGQVWRSLSKWVRPVATSSVDAATTLSRAHLSPLGKEGVASALHELGLVDMCPIVRSEDDAQVQPGVMCKTIALLTHETEVVLCVLRLSQRLQLSCCASAFGLRRTDVRMAREDELTDMVGYPRGSIGPVGSRHGAIVLLDQELAEEQRLLCGAGEEGWVFPISAAVMVEVLPDCRVVPLR